LFKVSPKNEGLQASAALALIPTGGEVLGQLDLIAGGRDWAVEELYFQRNLAALLELSPRRLRHPQRLMKEASGE
jgi:hypothetical protein